MKSDFDPIIPPDEEGTPEFADKRTVEELRGALHSMRTLLHLSALCGIILSGTIFVVLFKEVSSLRQQNDGMAAYINEYNSSFVPQAEAVRTNLYDFARFHPTLSPILQKYYSNSPAAAPARPRP